MMMDQVKEGGPAQGVVNAAPGDDDLITRARKRFTAAMEFDRQNDEAALEDLNFSVGQQWDADAIKERDDDERISVTINRTPQFIKQVVGEIRKRPPSMNVMPADGAADARTAHVYEGMLRAIERLSRAQDVYARAADSAARCSKGHMRVALEYADDDSFDMELFIRSIRNPFSVKWDPNSALPDKSDASWCFVYENMTEEAFKAKYPNASCSPFPVNRPLNKQSLCWTNRGGKIVTVAEYWEMERVPTMLLKVRDIASGVEKDLHIALNYDLNEYAAYLQQTGKVVLAARPSFRKVVVRYMLGGNEILEDRLVWPGKRIPIFTVVGEEVDVGDRTVQLSLIRFAKDPQRALNYVVSAQIEHAALAPKSPWLTAAEAVEGYEDDYVQASRRNISHVRYRAFDGEKNDRQLPKPERMRTTSTNPGLSELAASSSQYMKDTTGIYDASLGQRSNESSGVAIEARDAQADTSTFVYLDNLVSAIESMGREIVNLIPQVYSSRKMIRILGKDDAPAVIDMEAQGFSLDVGKYDVIVQTGQGFASQRKETAKGLTDLMKGLPPQIQVGLIPYLAKLQDWEDADEVADIITKIAMATGILPPPQGAMPPAGPPGAPPESAGPMPPQRPQMGPPAGPPQGRPSPFANLSRPAALTPAAAERVAPRPAVAGRAGMMGVM